MRSDAQGASFDERQSRHGTGGRRSVVRPFTVRTCRKSTKKTARKATGREWQNVTHIDVMRCGCALRCSAHRIVRLGHGCPYMDSSSGCNHPAFDALVDCAHISASVIASLCDAGLWAIRAPAPNRFDVLAHQGHFRGADASPTGLPSAGCSQSVEVSSRGQAAGKRISVDESPPSPAPCSGY